MNLIGTLLLFIAAVLQSTVFPILLPRLNDQYLMRPDLLLLLVVAVTLVDSLQSGLIWGFLGGLLLDLVSPLAFGTNALALVLVALLASLGTASPFRSNIVMPLGMVAGCTLFYYLFMMGLMTLFGRNTAVITSIINTVLPVILVNVILMPIFYTFLYWLSNRTRPTLPEEWQ